MEAPPVGIFHQTVTESFLIVSPPLESARIVWRKIRIRGEKNSLRYHKRAFFTEVYPRDPVPGKEFVVAEVDLSECMGPCTVVCPDSAKECREGGNHEPGVHG